MMIEPETEWSSDGPLMDDLWKKIQLPFLTPPCSPYREDLDLTSPLPQYEDFTTIDIPESFFTMPTTDLPLLEDNDMKVNLESVIDLENELDGCESGGLACQNLPFSRGTCTSCTQLALAGSELRHDCMWQGTCTAEAHSYHHNHSSDTPTLQQLNSRTHRDSSCYHLTDLLLDPNGALDSFNYLSDFDDLHDDNDDTDDLHHPRPDTPSESSETDTDEDERSYTDDDEEDYIGVSHEEEITTTTTTTASPSTSTAVHVDHSYFCPRIPSPSPSTTTRRSNTTTTSSSSQQHRSQRYHSRSSRLQASTDSEDEIDVVSVGSPDSAYSSSCSQSGSSKGGGGGDTRAGSDQSSDNEYPSPHHTATTTTYVTPDHTFQRQSRGQSNSTPKTRKRSHKQAHLGQEREVSSGVKRKASSSTTNQNNAVYLRKSPTKGNRRHHQQQQQQMQQQRGLSRRQQRRALRADLDDPEKRHLHNSLERMRRVDQKKAFDDLRYMVPELAEKDKVPKVEILKVAALYIHSVTRKERTLEEEKERLKQRQKELKKQLQALQRQKW